jgi:para-nitrobenzyl esterase
LCFLLTTLSSAAFAATTRRIDSGEIQGTAANGIVSFKGIPYAAPPVGDLRWRAPAPPAPWSGVRDCTAYGNDCMQLPVESDAAPLGTDPAESCLFVNVWTPDGAAAAAGGTSGSLPVMVWIHGGGFVNGGSSASIYDGSSFARQGIVVVSFNYRLGRFGFFSHPALTESQSGPQGNWGYLDQLEALRWVQRNVGVFGGDPKRVTIAGESAGGQSVLDLIASPAAKGLFHQAIAMSGGGRRFLGGFPQSGGDRRHPSAEMIGRRFAREHGISGDDEDAAAALRALRAEDVRGRANMTALLITTLLPLGPLQYARGPIVDGGIVVDVAEARYRDGLVANVPLLIGTTTADLGLWLPRSKDALFESFGPDAERARAAYDPDGKVPKQALVLLAAADRTMHEPARFIARRMTGLGNPVWLYRFGYVAESQRAGSAGAGHASELPYFFGTLDARAGSPSAASDRATAHAFHTYAANFVKGGDPNGAGLPVWPRFDPKSSDLMQFPREGNPSMAPDPWTGRLDLVERAAETLPPPVVVAQLAKSDWSGFAAVGVLSAPKYFGSSESRVVPVPLFEMEYRGRLFASVGTTGLAAAVGGHVLKRKMWSASAHVGVADRRPTSRDDVLAGLEDRGLGTTAGATIRRKHGLFSQSLTLAHGLDSGAGLTAKLGAGIGVPIGFKGAVSLNGTATFVDDRQMRYDFGIDAAEAAARQDLVNAGDPRLRQADAQLHVPGGGFQSVGGSASILALLSPKWVLAVLGSVTQLSDQAAESPLVEKNSQWTFGGGLGYRF